jgi:beta-1,4-mannosyl-glycoprotein beta-1,4-N-acetylglucosaminyltransferase
MIVKNEEHVIEKTLKNLIEKIPLIDYYVISDTGSTDNTIECITNFFKNKNINGEIYQDEWKDFGYNRTKALEYAFNKSEYLLIFDADDELYGDIKLPDLNEKQMDGYFLKFGPGILYERMLLIKNDIQWSFKGVLHEYLHTDKQNLKTLSIEGNYFINSGKTGARSQDPNKYKNDAIILEKAYYEAKKNNDDLKNRYCFYTAQSYFDANDRENAMIWYKKVLDHENWIQEKYYSCLRIFFCYKDLNKEDEGLYYLVKSIHYDYERYDCLFELIRYYCSRKMDRIVWLYYSLIKENYETNHLQKKIECHEKLFVNEWYGNLGIPYYMIITSINLGYFETTLKMYDIIFNKKQPEKSEFYISHMLMNINCIYDRILDKKLFQKNLREYLLMLKKIDYPIEKHQDIFNKYLINNEKDNIEKCKESNKILIYVGYAYQDWNYSFYSENAIGGSETTALQLALNISSDYEIYMVGSLKHEKYQNIEFIHYNNAHDLIQNSYFKLIIVSRYLDFFNKYQYNTEKLLLWAHDTNFHYKELLPIVNIKIDQVICLTNWHKNEFEKMFPYFKNKIKIIPNGISLIPYRNLENKIKDSFIYSSCSERGLEKIVNLWGELLKYKPNAKLFICSYNTFPTSDLDYKINEKIKLYSNSIIHLGKYKKSQLYDLMKTCEYWFYPTNWLETFCITALEMMSFGIICFYYPLAGLIDTIGDNGIILPYDKEIETIINLNENDKNLIIEKGFNHVKKYHWDNIIKLWKPYYSSLYLILIPFPFDINNLTDYLDSLSSKYQILYTNNLNYAKSLYPSKVFFINGIFNNDIYNHFYKLNIEINILNTEPLNIKERLECILGHIKFYELNYIYDYSKSNIYILNQNNINNTIHFPYIIYESESNFLKKINKETKKEYDFGILLKDDKIERRNKVIHFLKENNYKINIIYNKWKKERDYELAKCKFILNIHGFWKNPTQIFETIRCNRLLDAGFNIISEESIYYNENKQTNLIFLKYTDFFNLSIIQNLLKEKKIIDCFIFYNEIELLNYRLNILNNIVDYFIIIEAKQTFMGKSKPLYFDPKKYEKFMSKIIYISIDLPHLNVDIKKNEQWINEQYQRNYIDMALKFIPLHDNDYIILSDIDEIPDPNVLKTIQNSLNSFNIKSFEQDFYYYNLNCKHQLKWYFPKIFTFQFYKQSNLKLSDIRNSHHDSIKCGWHLSYFNTPENISNKIQNFSHQELNIEKFINIDSIQSKMNNKKDLFDRPIDIFENISISKNDYLPIDYNIYLQNFYIL